MVRLHVSVLSHAGRDVGTWIQIPEIQEKCLSSLPNSTVSQTGHVRPGVDALFPERKKDRCTHFPASPLVQCLLLRILCSALPRHAATPSVALSLELPSACLSGWPLLSSTLS